jgi:hypothetical protein
LCSEDLLTLDEQLDFAVRQAGPIKEVVAPCQSKYVTPFLDERWISFILNTNIEYRYDLKLYKKILIRGFPVLFSLPTKTEKGLPLTSNVLQRSLNRGILSAQSLLWNIKGTNLIRTRAINYIDFDKALRTRGDINSLAKENLADLERRGICDWLDINKIWKCHLDGIQDLGRALTQLISLEIYMKAKS